MSQDLDPFDLICHVVYDQPPLTRRERADNVKKHMLCSTAYLWPSYDYESLPQVACIKSSQSCPFAIAPWSNGFCMTITGTAHYELRKNETQRIAQYWMLEAWQGLGRE
ncbi:type I restriction-modification enzyme R subunit C-terminal domain-containing protein [Aeromonas sp. MR7]|uniref:type I restriction-modification enzyme R subunit C-terminal domain-containing protein n=1 Tax=Aeromonas sp. MR7 TaxID=2923419 RepID=UPI0030DA6CA2